MIGIAAVAAPGIHTLTDIAEWMAGGFFRLQLWANYWAFITLPFLMVGLYAVQRPGIRATGLAGALLYGVSFVYFAHTTQYALVQQTPDYATLWDQLGTVYTLHGVLMVAGGLLFGVASFRVRYFPAWTSAVFLTGLTLNALLGVLATPELLQTLGSALRNLGLMGMGWSLLRTQDPS